MQACVTESKTGGRMLILSVIFMVFLAYYGTFHRGQVHKTMGSCDVISIVLFTMNAMTGVGGFWIPDDRSLRAAMTVHVSLFLLTVSQS